jgi:hypothetical protein
MKSLMIVLVALIPFLSGCHEKDNSGSTEQVKSIAWNSLSTQEKSTVTINWNDAPVAKTTYNSKSAYAVMFNTKDDALLGPIIVYIDYSTMVVLGKGLRE